MVNACPFEKLNDVTVSTPNAISRDIYQGQSSIVINREAKKMDAYYIRLRNEMVADRLERLKIYGFKTIDDYLNEVDSGMLPKHTIFSDAPTFDGANPEHPLASSQRFPRIEAADEILIQTRELREYIYEPILEELHQVLMDCCATVALTISRALLYCGNESSLPIIEKVMTNPWKSKMIANAARFAHTRIMCEMGKLDMNGKSVVLLSDRLELASFLFDYVEDKGLNLIVLGAWGYAPLAENPSLLRVFDRDYISSQAWSRYCVLYRKQFREKTGAIASTPHLFIEKDIRQAELDYLELPPNRVKTLYFQNAGPEIVAEIIERCMGKRPLNMRDIVNSSNRRLISRV